MAITDRLVVLFVRMTVVCVSPYRVNRPCGNLLLVLSRPRPGPMNRLALMVASPEPAFDLPTPAYPGLDRQPPGSGTQPVPNYTQTGNQPGFVRQADPNISGVGQTTTGFRDAAGEQPLPTRTIAEGKGIQLVLVNRGPTDRFGDTCSWRWRH